MITLTNAVYSRKDVRFQAFLICTFAYMLLGIVMTGIVSHEIASSPQLMNKLLSTNQVMEDGQLIVKNSLSWLWFVCAALELLLVWKLTRNFSRMSYVSAMGVFVFYAVLNGITITPALAMYTDADISLAFFSTAGVFGSAAIYGLVTKRDLSSVGSFCMVGLMGALFAIVVHQLFGGSQISFTISAVLVLIFTGLAAYDIQKLKILYMHGIGRNDDTLAVYGALTLYLDFINMFLLILRLFGGKR